MILQDHRSCANQLHPGPCIPTGPGGEFGLWGAVQEALHPRSKRDGRWTRKPETAEHPPRPRRSAAHAKLEAIYGSRLTLVNEGKRSERALTGLARVPEPIHRIVAHDFATGPAGAGIYIGDQPGVMLTPELRHLADQKPNGWSEGSTWRNVGGMYASGERQLVIGDAGYSEQEDPVGDVAQHELGHALDRALGQPSVRDPRWEAALTALARVPGFTLHPYFTQEGNPNAWLLEGFAQALHGWTVGRGMATNEARGMAMAEALGKPDRRRLHQDIVEPIMFMISVFDQVAGENT